MDHCYRHYYANIHRGVYTIAEEATAAYELARRKVAALRRRRFGVGDRVHAQRDRGDQPRRVHVGPRQPARRRRVVLSHMEHHANVVPWHMLAAERGVELRWIPMTDDFRLDLSDLDQLLDGARLLAITAMSNVLGTINDIRPLADAAHAHDALVLVDACQYVPHVATDVQAWDADFIAFSAHKMCGPSGIGALWARAGPARGDAAVPRRRRDDPRRSARRLLDQRRPVEIRSGHAGDRRGGRLRGGRRLPPGPRHGRGRAITRCGSRATRSTRSRDRFPEALRIFGPLDTSIRGGAVSFLFDGIHAHDISQVLDEDAVCVRAGHHCAKPLMRQLGVPATTRASVYVYNDETDIDVLVEALAKAQKFFTP